VTATASERELAFLRHMLQAAQAVKEYSKGGKRRFLADNMAQDAIMRQLEVLGEAARRISDEFRQEQPELPWRSMIGLRNILIHGYDSVDLEKVWQAVGVTVNQALPLLERWLQA